MFQLLIKDTLRQVLSLVVISPQVGESVVEDITVISEDDDRFIPTGFTAIAKAHDDGESHMLHAIYLNVMRFKRKKFT
mgnify:CR=1 FL=1